MRKVFRGIKNFGLNTMTKIVKKLYLWTVTKLPLLRPFRRVTGTGLLAVRSMVGDIGPPEARTRGVCPGPESLRGRYGRDAGVEVVAGKGRVASEAGAAHCGAVGGDLHGGCVRLLRHPRDKVERLLVMIWTVVIWRYLRSIFR